jgi:hypothetical protein
MTQEMNNPDPAAQFLAAHTNYNQARDAYNASPASQRTGTDTVTPLYEQAHEAAVRFVAAAADRHHVEEKVTAYLSLGPDGWKIDAPTFDGYPLEGYRDGAVTDACEHEDEHADECDALRQAAEYLPLPTGPELGLLLHASAVTIAGMA